MLTRDGSRVPETEGASSTGHVVPADTSPTWELEPIISGAVTFSLLKAPGAVSELFEQMRPHVTGAWDTALFLSYYYVKSAVYALIAIFIVHLVARSYWVGIVGLNTVFPGGVQWDRFDSGPNTRQVYEERMPALRSIAERTDNFCSTLFSFGFLIVLVFVVSLALIAVGGLVWVAVKGRSAGAESLHFERSLALWLVIGVIAFIGPITSLIDKRFGPRLPPDGRLARTIRRIAAVYYRMFGFGSYGPIMLTLRTNLPKRVFVTVFYLMTAGVLTAFLLELVITQGVLSVSSYRYLPEDPDAHGVEYAHYESLRPATATYTLTPSIQSDIIRDPFVKLFIPYNAERHNTAIAKRCPSIPALRVEGLHFHVPTEAAIPDSTATAVLRCLAEIHQVTLNGATMPDLEFRFYTHPQSHIQGIIAYIRADSLHPGRNDLVVQPVPRLRVVANARPPQPYLIPFWR